MLGSSIFRSASANYTLMRYLLLVTQVVILVTTFVLTDDCRATALASPARCIAHMNGTNHEHEHFHAQPAAILSLTGVSSPFPFTRVNLPSALLSSSALLQIIKPPPQVG